MQALVEQTRVIYICAFVVSLVLIVHIRNVNYTEAPTQLERFIASDQPGRIFAVFVFAPILFKHGVQYDDWFIQSFAISLCAWDLYCLLVLPSRSLLA